MLLTHASNQHWLVLPVAAITELARRRGIDVICDCAQSWGLVDFRIDGLGGALVSALQRIAATIAATA
jgi:selenocysteine lyase/cysteine desulfurase